MKKVLFIGLLLSVISIGCTQSQQKGLKHFKSNLIGLHREVTLYSATGSIIRKWKGDFQVETFSSGIAFITDDGNEVKIGGTFIVEEVSN